MAGLTPKKRDGWWYAVGSVGGRRIRQSLGTRDRGEAKEACAQLAARLFKAKTYGEDTIRTFAEAFISYVEGGGENRYSEPIVRHFGSWELSKIKAGDITAAARKLKPDANAATRNRQVITPTRAIINHAANLGWCPPIRVKHFKVETARRVSVERSWIDAFVAQADADGLPHLSAIVLMMFQTGTRVSEACRVKPDDIDLEKRVIILNRTKTGTFRPKHITRELADRIAALDLDPEKPVFGYADRFGVRNRMIAVCRRAGLEFVSPHQAGRHSFATNALAMGATLKDAMEAGDWKSSRLFLETYAKSEKAGQITADLFDAQNETGVRRTGTKLTHTENDDSETPAA